MTPRVVAVIVTYHPDENSLRGLMARIRPQVAHTIQVDNTEREEATQACVEHNEAHTVIRLGQNTGIGCAQNRGFEEARRLLATHVLLLDQDSLPPPDLLTRLLGSLNLEGAEQVAAIGPACRDIKTGDMMPLIQRKGWWIRRTQPEDSRPVAKVAYIPASGSLIPMAMLDRVGDMRGEYFIDRVDVEWCLRAVKLGLQVWVDTGAEMLHDQGTEAVALAGRTVYVGHEFRKYFHVRNSLAMALRARIPMFWRIDQLLKTPAYVAFYCAVSRRGRARMAGLLLHAVADGLTGKMGKGYFENRPFR